MEMYKFRGSTEKIRYYDLALLVAFFLVPMLAQWIFQGMYQLIAIAVMSVILGVVTVVLHSFKYEVSADENGVTIKRIIFGKVLTEQSYGYDEVGMVDCYVQKHSTKNLKYYLMVFSIGLPDGKKLSIGKRLKCKYNSARKNPADYYSAVLDEQMMQTRSYILNNKTRVHYKNHPRPED